MMTTHHDELFKVLTELENVGIYEIDTYVILTHTSVIFAMSFNVSLNNLISCSLPCNLHHITEGSGG